MAALQRALRLAAAAASGPPLGPEESRWVASGCSSASITPGRKPRVRPLMAPLPCLPLWPELDKAVLRSLLRAATRPAMPPRDRSAGNFTQGKGRVERPASLAGATPTTLGAANGSVPFPMPPLTKAYQGLQHSGKTWPPFRAARVWRKLQAGAWRRDPAFPCAIAGRCRPKATALPQAF